ncbi:DUF2283 domain-containing protein [Marinifilum fragile]|uniref:DUF2283 domain-containing protein n=1 Tax=Marinifilum fragile TaxID=570161 RepID=UPI002AA73339|nr:DUF2283 domain-containing protein [Marinifilum fragile]
MKLEYDKEVDGLYIWFVDIEKDKPNYDSEIWPNEFKDEFGILFDKNGHIMGIEIQPASKYFNKNILTK